MELGESLSPEDINCLKNRLLLIPEFIDNEYLKLYYELIIKNQKKREYVKFETQSHHIVPRAYFRENQIPVDNSKTILLF